MTDLDYDTMKGIDKVFRLRADPTICPAGYSLHLYCKYENPDHRWNEFPHEISDQGTYGRSVAEARREGWIIYRDRTATCPRCAKKLKEKT